VNLAGAAPARLLSPGRAQPREHLKIVVLGPPEQVVDLMNLVRVWLDQLEP
jgi:hypothetical protein